MKPISCFFFLLILFGSNAQEKTLGIMDLRKEALHNAQFNASKYSQNGLILLYMGDSLELAMKVHEGASLAKEKGTPIQGMVLAKSNPAFENGRDCYVILWNGGSVTKEIDATDYPKIRAESLSKKAYERFKDSN